MTTRTTLNIGDTVIVTISPEHPGIGYLAGETGVVIDVFSDGAIVRVVWDHLTRWGTGDDQYIDAQYISDIGACALELKGKEK